MSGEIEAARVVGTLESKGISQYERDMDRAGKATTRAQTSADRLGASVRAQRTSMQAAGATAQQNARMVERSQERVRNAYGRAEQSVTRYAKYGLAIGAVATSGFIAKSVQLYGQIEQSKIAFTTLLGSAQKAGAYLVQLKKFAASTPFEFVELQDQAKRLMAMGFQAKEVLPTLRILGDAVAALGGGAPMLDRVTLAISQMQAKGKVMAQEVNQLAENGIPAWEILSKAMHKPVAELMQMAEQGKSIKSTIAVPALLAGLNQRFHGLMSKQSQTVLGLWSNFKDKLGFLMMDIGDEMVRRFDLRSKIAQLTKTMGSAEFKARVMEIVGAAGRAAEAVGEVAKVAYEYRREIVQAAKATLVLWGVMKGVSIVSRVTSEMRLLALATEAQAVAASSASVAMATSGRRGMVLAGGTKAATEAAAKGASKFALLKNVVGLVPFGPLGIAMGTAAGAGMALNAVADRQRHHFERVAEETARSSGEIDRLVGRIHRLRSKKITVEVHTKHTGDRGDRSPKPNGQVQGPPAPAWAMSSQAGAEYKRDIAQAQKSYADNERKIASAWRDKIAAATGLERAQARLADVTRQMNNESDPDRILALGEAFDEAKSKVSSWEGKVKSSNKTLDTLHSDNKKLEKTLGVTTPAAAKKGGEKVVSALDLIRGGAKSVARDANTSLGSIGNVRPDMSGIKSAMADVLAQAQELAATIDGFFGGGGSKKRRRRRNRSRGAGPTISAAVAGEGVVRSRRGDRISARSVGIGPGTTIDYLGKQDANVSVEDALYYARMEAGSAWESNAAGGYDANTEVQAFLQGRIGQNQTKLDKLVARKPKLPGLIKAQKARVRALGKQLGRLMAERTKLRNKLRNTPSGKDYASRRLSLQNQIASKTSAINSKKAELKKANAKLEKLSGERDSVADEIAAAADQIVADQASLDDPNKDIAGGSDSDALAQAELDRQRTIAANAEANLRLSQRETAAFASMLQPTTVININSISGYDPAIQRAIADATNGGNAMGGNADVFYSGRL